MRCRISCQKFTRRAPIRLVANRPVISTIASVITAPIPGTWTPSQFSVRNSGGSSGSTLSSESTISFSTHRVMTSGIQISRPVMMYFFMCWKQKGPAQSRARCLAL
jgi:hypothetical protein